MNEIERFATAVTENVEKVIVGKRRVIQMMLVTMLCDGHVLIDDAPGTGKTMLARSIAISLGLTYKRLQCTPDLLPNDVTGVSVYNQKTGEFEFRPGPAFANVLLADEINRATPRTQSALLESMAEGQISVEGLTRHLERPFLVLATQNPIEFEGTFPLPEAQLDRFLLKLSIGYPTFHQEGQMLLNLQHQHPIESLQKAVEGVEILTLQEQVQDIHIESHVRDYILTLVHATREHKDLSLGASPRASLALFKSGQAYAALQGRDYVQPDDVKAMAPFILPHRLILQPESALGEITTQSIVVDLLRSTRVPLGSAEEKVSS